MNLVSPQILTLDEKRRKIMILITVTIAVFALILNANCLALADINWSVGTTSFQPGKSEPAIREKLPLLKDMGGTVYLRVDNNGSEPLHIADIAVGNIAVELDSLQDGAIVLMGEKDLAGSLTPNTKSLLP